jgi:hypothetical protein
MTPSGSHRSATWGNRSPPAYRRSSELSTGNPMGNLGPSPDHRFASVPIVVDRQRPVREVSVLRVAKLISDYSSASGKDFDLCQGQVGGCGFLGVHERSNRSDCGVSPVFSRNKPENLLLGNEIMRLWKTRSQGLEKRRCGLKR